ncbi:hypothetical protein [Streptomyces chiangmaiensis]|uniref:Uncharacterized protein n=1 Tax=Streptomyces chiangmaiensis TaxID=766497 RepID=A0ABU7FHW5_9ACTN|nr:hypothetical protein [Streptomyces chiangmaiensis]MED7823725.1 hypothetical protein [Streptomyces chiangmaiensis]
MTSRCGSGAVVPATSLLTRIPSAQQFRCMVLSVLRGELSFGDDITAFSYQALIDRQVIAFS